MFNQDRPWWLSALLALAFAAVAVTYPVLMLSTSLPLDAELGQPMTRDLFLSGAIAAICLIMALVLPITSVRARARARRRAAALHGQQDAVPLAHLAPDPASAPDIFAEPLVLSWRGARLGSGRSLALEPYWFFLPLLCPLLPMASNGIPQVMAYLSHLAPAVFRVLAAIAMLVLLALLVVIGVVAARYAPTLFGRPYGVTADSEGITYRTEFGGHRFLPWSDMRLLEVSGTGQGEMDVRRFSLYGDRVRVMWSDGPSSETHMKSAGISTEEMTLRQRALLNLIAARTGLVPRTFSRGLRAKESGAHSSSTLTNVAVVVVITAVCLGCASAVLLLPFSTSAVFNAVVAASLTLLALIIAGVGAALAIGRLLRLRAQTRVPAPVVVTLQVAAPPLDAPHARYTLTTRTPPLYRLPLVLIGMLLVVECMPGVLTISTRPIFHILGPGAFPQMHDLLGYLLGCILGFFGLMGIMAVPIAMIISLPAIHADANGLWRGATSNTPWKLPWDKIEDIAVRMRGDQVIAYVARGEAGRIAIGWSALRSQVGHGTPSDGALPISPDELAALVVKRSGKSLRLASRL